MIRKTGGQQAHEILGEVFKKYDKQKRFTVKDFDELKAAYVAKYGYQSAVPDFGDIVHTKLPGLMSDQEKKDLKMKHLQQILASPAPDLARSYGSVMTWIDNVQDAMTVGVVAAHLLIRLAPKIMARFVPGLGWALLAYDVLNLVNLLARTPMNPLGIKRNTCKVIRDNPFTRKAQKGRIQKLLDMKVGFGALLETLQTLDNVAGVGLCLGGVVGYIQDMGWGLYRKATGARVTSTWDMPQVDVTRALVAFL